VALWLRRVQREDGHAKEGMIADDVPQRAEATHRDRGFRILADILDDGARSDVRDLLYDSVTELPSLQLLLTQLRTTLEARRQVGLLTLIVNPSVRLEELFGWVTYDEVLRAVAAALREIKTEALRQDDVIAELSMSGNSFVLLLSPPRYQPFILHDDLTKLRQRLSQQLRDRLAHDFPPAVAARFTSSMGCCVLTHEPDVPVQRLVLRALDQAYADAFRERDADLAARLAKLDGVIERRELTTLYQPIVDLQGGGVLGYEALTRGPPGELQDPSVLFKLAYEADAVWRLDRACRELALAGARELPEGALLFLNTDPDSIFDPRPATLAGPACARGACGPRDHRAGGDPGLRPVPAGAAGHPGPGAPARPGRRGIGLFRIASPRGDAARLREAGHGDHYEPA
jgi:GGDEF domain-containing protein